MGKIEGKIRNVIFNSESGFLVAVFRVKKAHDELLKELEGKSITITGMMAEQNTFMYFSDTGNRVQISPTAIPTTTADR